MTTVPALSPQEARARLAAAWEAANPQTPDDIARFYETCSGDLLADDLEMFHSDPERQRWTTVLAHIALTFKAERVVDIGCGSGHDLDALSKVLDEEVRLYGVEPNNDLRTQVNQRFKCYADVIDAPIEMADVLACFDVLEHVPDPETFLTVIAQRAKIGAFLVETCATHDIGTPLHLRENRGWKTGHALEAAGWEKSADEGRLRVWQKVATEPVLHTSMIVCAYRGVSIPTLRSMLETYRRDAPKGEFGWRTYLGGEAGINRARSIAISMWYRDTAEDVLLMIDDDIVFTPAHAERIVNLCRSGFDVICAAYPVRDGGHLAVKGLGQELTFHPAAEPLEVRHGSTGFIAIHRKVIDALVPTLKLCHANTDTAFWPMFDFATVESEHMGGYEYLSEDWFFCDAVRALGFKVWLDPAIRLGHLAQIELNVANMFAVRDAVLVGR